MSPRHRQRPRRRASTRKTQRERLDWLERAFLRGQEQLSLARAVQQRLLPPPLVEVPGMEVAARFLPSATISGDFMDYFLLDTTQLGLYLGDVEGKGLEAAMYALLVSGVMRGLHKTDQRPAEVVRLLNKRLLERRVPGKFCCFTYALFDLRRPRLWYANAGLPRPWLIRNGEGERLAAHGFPVGMFDDCEASHAEVALRPGDFVVFYTDGLPDSLQFLRRRGGDGETQVEGLLRGASNTSAGALADGFVSLLEDSQKRRDLPLHDDMTLLVMRVRGTD